MFRIGFWISVLAIAAVTAFAEDLKIRSPIIESGELELEHNFVFGHGNKTTIHEIEYGFLPWLKLGVEGEFAGGPGQGLHFDAAALEGFVQFWPQGKYPEFFDLGLFEEYEHTARTGDPRSLLTGPMVQREQRLLGLDLLYTGNFFIHKDMGMGSVGAPSLLLAQEVRWRFDPHFEPGVQYYGSHITLGHQREGQRHFIGPSLAGRVGFRELGLNAAGAIKYDAALLRGLTPNTLRDTVRVRIELEFPF